MASYQHLFPHSQVLTMPQAAGPFFGRLPAELRLLILSFLTFDWVFMVVPPVLPSFRRFKVLVSRRRLGLTRVRRNVHLWALKSLVNLAKTCRLLDREALAQIYHLQTFVFDGLAPMTRLLSVLRPGPRNALRSIVIKPPKHARDWWKRDFARLVARLDGVEELVWKNTAGIQPIGLVFEQIIQSMAAKNLKTVNGRPVEDIIGDDFDKLPDSPAAIPVAATEPTVMAPISLPGNARRSGPNLSIGKTLRDIFPDLDLSFLINDPGPSSGSHLSDTFLPVGTHSGTSTTFASNTGYSSGTTYPPGSGGSSGFNLPSGTDASFTSSIPWSTPTFDTSVPVNASSTPFANPSATFPYRGTPNIGAGAPIAPFSAPETLFGTSTFNSGTPANTSGAHIFPTSAPNMDFGSSIFDSTALFNPIGTSAYPSSAPSTIPGTSIFDSSAPFDRSSTSTFPDAASADLYNAPTFPSAAPHFPASNPAIRPGASYYPDATGSYITTSLLDTAPSTRNTYQHTPENHNLSMRSFDWSDPSINSSTGSAFESSFQPAMGNIQSVTGRPGTVDSSVVSGYSSDGQGYRGMLSGNRDYVTD